MRHVVNVILLIIIGTAALLFFMNIVDWLPVAAAEEAGPIDNLFRLHLNVIAFLYVLVMGFVLYSVFAFRRKPGDESEGAYIHGNTTLEIIWTVVPLITVIIFGSLGASTLKETMAKEPDELQVFVTARQWSWTFEYTDLGITSSELVLPVDKQVHLSMTSDDVIHSFWAPVFRLKQDTVPGITTQLRFKPTRIGEYKVLCAELCGLSHAYMVAPIIVMNANDFEVWTQKKLGTYVSPEGEGGKEAEADPVVLGAQVAQANGCLACHSVDGSPLVGPSWLGLYGKTEKLEDGSTVVVDEAYLHESIVDPSAAIVEGFSDLMPKTFADTLSDQDIENLIAYIKSLAE